MSEWKEYTPYKPQKWERIVEALILFGIAAGLAIFLLKELL